MAQDSESRTLDKVIVRLPDGMRDFLKYAATENKRSLNAEIVHRLDRTIMEDDARERDNRLNRATELVVEGIIDQNDLADDDRTSAPPSADYEPTILDHITAQLSELSRQQVALADQLAEVQEALKQPIANR